MHNGKVNWAVVGVGAIVQKRVGPALLEQPDSTIYACIEVDPEVRQEQINALSPQKVGTDIEQALSDEKVDAVYLATPVHLHSAQAIAALRAGKDVLVEKPVALCTKDAEEVCRVADETGRWLATAYFRRHWERFQIVKDMLNRGDFGQVVLVRFASHTWYGLKPEDQGAWRGKRVLSGGGVLSDVGCHKFDLLSWWFGLPRQLIADVRTLTHDVDVEDSAAMLMTLADGAQVTGSFHWNSKTWTDEIHVVGTEAKITFHPCDGDEVVITVGRDIQHRKILPPVNHHYPLVDDFTRAVVEDRPPRFGRHDGLQATKILDAVYQSSLQECWVEVV